MKLIIELKKKKLINKNKFLNFIKKKKLSIVLNQDTFL
jgi:hypothetical protein